ncbi:hypothetical protein [Ensifer sp. LCM 4579]|uniref:hypothetical protein n=1 Tax=Ensifer sp. LCM 4579 TaxID=1848292 RepID=UPI001FCDB172|nr:hypothetical protein [Ensifer sp. LCM 4579]
MTVKRTADLEPGELLRMSFGNSAAIVLFLKKLNYEEGLFGILESEDFTEAMTWYATSLDDVCLSYGNDWVLEETHGSETACGLQHKYESARLFLDKSGLIMAFRPPQRSGRYQTFYYSLAKLEEEKLGRDPAPISHWRVWGSRDDFERGGTSLFEMPQKKS